MLEKFQCLELELDVLLDHHPLKDDVVVGRPHLLEERVVELRLDLGRRDAARVLELLGRDADVLHVGAEHEVHQVLVLIVHLLVLVLLVDVWLKDWKQSKVMEGVRLMCRQVQIERRVRLIGIDRRRLANVQIRSTY